MSDSLLPVLIMLIVAVGMAGGMLAGTHGKVLLRRTKLKVARAFPTAKVDHSPYECGMKPYDRVVRHRFSIHFYLVAMVFILFDIEAAFMIPWAVTFRDFDSDKLFVLGEMGVFLGILIVGFAYLWKRGALEWD